MKKLVLLSSLLLATSAFAHEHHHHQHSNPAVNKAMKECYEATGKTHDQAKLEACMKDKGFEKPAHHPKHDHKH
ncbi:MAG: hypothetical protein Q4B95_05450 [Lonepinella koalarum]|nr:hypothetical protein [Lonepinella koalarum]